MDHIFPCTPQGWKHPSYTLADLIQKYTHVGCIWQLYSTGIAAIYHGLSMDTSGSLRMHSTSYGLIVVYLIVHSRCTFKPLGFALWFKYLPLVYNSNKPLYAIV